MASQRLSKHDAPYSHFARRVVVTFRITGLDPKPFRHLFGLPGDDLRKHGVVRYLVDAKPGYPDRIEVRDAEPGESVLLLNYTHQPAYNPYRSSHAIFVLEDARAAYDRVDEVPDAMRIRPMSLRAFDSDDLMVDADVVDGRELEGLIERFLVEPRVAYLHAHYARRGCYAARIDRA
jgi:Protein of unknown function (DUF1203)